jgi:hypothetical protein
MPFIQTVTSGLLSRHAAKRVSRVIPNPIVRYVVVTATTALVPIIVNRAAKHWRERRARRGQRRQHAHGAAAA